MSANETKPVVHDGETLDVVAAKAIDQLNSEIAIEAEKLGLVGILLTGSFARREGTLIREPDGSIQWLSDIEYVAIVPPRALRNSEAIKQTLAKALASSANKLAAKVDFGVIGADVLPKLRDSIFARELAANAKLIWGNPRTIVLPTTTCENDFRRDGLRLLHNRIVEQLELRVRYEQGQSPALETYFAIQKLWQDIGTSLSIFLNCYQPSYRRRLEALEGSRYAMWKELGRCSDRLLVSIRTATLARFGSFAPNFDFENQFRDSWRVAAGVWKWENKSFTGREVSLKDWKAIPRCIRRATSISSWAHDYYKALRSAGRAIRPTRTSIRPALASGSPGNAIYAAACLLFIFWDSIKTGTEDGLRAIEFAGRVLHRRSAAAELHSVARSIYDVWRQHLRAG